MEREKRSYKRGEKRGDRSGRRKGEEGLEGEGEAKGESTRGREESSAKTRAKYFDVSPSPHSSRSSSPVLLRSSWFFRELLFRGCIRALALFWHSGTRDKRSRSPNTNSLFFSLFAAPPPPAQSPLTTRSSKQW